MRRGGLWGSAVRTGGRTDNKKTNKNGRAKGQNLISAQNIAGGNRRGTQSEFNASEDVYRDEYTWFC